MPDRDLPEALAARLDTAGGIDADDLREALDAMDDAGRLAFVRSLHGRRQVRLFDLVDGHMEGSLTQLVPADVSPDTTAVFEGRNSMAMFNLFQKRFARPAEREQLWGYNHQPWAWFTGPGYFVVEPDPDRGELVFDYERIPERALPGWPVLTANVGFPKAMVYGSMTDVVRPVSRDVFIGMAIRNEKPRGQFFTLCRAELTS